MGDRVIVSSPINRGMVGTGDAAVKVRVTSKKFNNTISVRLPVCLDDDVGVMQQRYREALHDKLISVGLCDPEIMLEDEIFGAHTERIVRVEPGERVIERTETIRVQPTERVIEKTHEVRVEPHIEQRVIERTTVKYEPVSGWLLLATGTLGGALGVAAKVAWVALFL